MDDVNDVVMEVVEETDNPNAEPPFENPTISRIADNFIKLKQSQKAPQETLQSYERYVLLHVSSSL